MEPVPKARDHFHWDSMTDSVAWNMVLSKNKTRKRKKKYAELAILATIQAGAA